MDEDIVSGFKFQALPTTSSSFHPFIFSSNHRPKMNTVLIASLAPVVILLIYVYKKDSNQKEPVKMLLKALLGGVLAALLDIILLTALSFTEITQFSSAFSGALYQAFCQAALPEEACKLFFLYIFIWKSQYFDEYFDGLEYAACVGLGFAGLENIMYVIQGGMGVAIGRAIFAVPAHFFFAIFMGYFFALAKFRPWKKGSYLVLAYIVPVILHGLYDFILMYKNILDEARAVPTTILSIIFFVFFIFVAKQATKSLNNMSGK